MGPVSIQMVIRPSDYFSVASLSRNSSSGRLPEDTGSPDAAVTFHQLPGTAQPSCRPRPSCLLFPAPTRSLSCAPGLSPCPHAVGRTHVTDLLVFPWVAKPTQSTPSITVLVLMRNGNGRSQESKKSFTQGLVKAISPLG